LFSIKNNLPLERQVEQMSAKKIPIKLGEKLLAIRKHLGYTLDEMAEAVGKPGLSRRTRVYEWEKGTPTVIIIGRGMERGMPPSEFQGQREGHLKSEGWTPLMKC